jgi:hypothetical protein
MQTDSMGVNKASLDPVVRLAAIYDAMIQQDPSGAFLAMLKPAVMLSSDQQREYVVHLEPQDGSESQQDGNSDEMWTWRGQLGQVVALAAEIDAGTATPGVSSAVMTSGDNQYAMTLQF